MMLAVRESKKYLPADYKPDPDGDFKPGIVNSVVFLVSAVQQVSREPTSPPLHHGQPSADSGATGQQADQQSSHHRSIPYPDPLLPPSPP